VFETDVFDVVGSVEGEDVLVVIEVVGVDDVLVVLDVLDVDDVLAVSELEELVVEELVVVDETVREDDEPMVPHVSTM
jgi:hypothetical protein